ncbi:serine/threonine-protein phosphatase 6 regulatory ankyrin repeat subunit C isoform X3 [Tursiops truncatus]|uniref:serine/threonine-protein phosphatase 6 regulatory ankyrin repeat subunit C isoform X3 n=1 Tax=Tursiops truncatus TaxID=9739 RepID=UPI003CCFBCFC
MGILSITDQPPLVQAIFSRDVEEVRSLLSQKENINVLDQERRTPLHAAAYVGDVPILQLLLMSGANVNAKDTLWLTPLHRAAASRNEKVLGLLLAHSADVNARDKLWQTPLHVAAANRATKCAEALAPLLSSLNVADRSGRSALHHAVHSGHLETVNLLLSKGASLNVCDKKERQPLHWAAFLGHLEVLKLLVARGADLGCKDRKGYGLLHTAAASGQIEVVKYLLRMGAEIDEPNAFGNTALHIACYLGQDAVAIELVNAGANVNQPNDKGFTPLHVAAVSTNGALCLELLVNNGADVNYQSKEGKSPLHMAAIHGRFTRSQILIQNGSEIDCADKFGNTPLHVAARYGHELLISTLMTNGADTARRGIHDMFPLHLAVLFGFSDCCRKLLSSGQLYSIVSSLSNEHVLSAGFDINTPDNLGRTCLHAAASGGNVECLNLLLSSGADLRRRDKFGRTPLHYAAANGSYQCAVTLVTAGAGVNEADCKGCSPLHYAAASDTYRRAEPHSSSSHDAEEDEPLKESRRKEAFLLRTRRLSSHGSRAQPLRGMWDLPGPGHEPVSPASAGGLSTTAPPGKPKGLFIFFKRYLKSKRLNYVIFGNCLEFLLDNGADPSLRDRQGYTAVHYAAAYGNRQNLELLLEMSFNCLEDVESTIPVSPLHLAAYNGHCEALKTLAETLVNLDVRDHKGRTALFLATERGSTECVEVLTAHGASALIKERKRKWTPLHAAAASGHTDSLHLLIDSGERADITDVMDAYGQTPLMLAIMNGHVDCVHLLLEKGSTADAADLRGRTALHRGAVTGCEDCLAALLDHDAFVLCRDFKGRTPIHLASACGHTAVLRTLLQAALSTDPLDTGVDYSGYSPMHWASYTGHEDCLELLLEHSPFSYLEGNPFTPLHCAVINNQDSTTEMLLGALGAKIVNSRDAKGRTPLHAAAFADNVSGLRMLLQHQAEVNATDHTGRTALMTAAENGQTAAVEFLLYRGKADLTVLDENKNTALHLACSKVPPAVQGHEKCALMILAETQDLGLINATNSALQMPLHIAARNGLASVVQALLSRGATVLAVDEEGHTPALACAPNKDVADCLALILSTMKPFPPKDAVSPFSFSLLKNCGIAAAKTMDASCTLQAPPPHTCFEPSSCHILVFYAVLVQVQLS